jgi:hypothetical protein
MTQLGLDWDAPIRSRTAAREALTPHGLREDHRRILEALAGGPLTDDEIRERTGLNANSVRPRRGELVTRGEVVPVDRRGVSAAGRCVTRWGLR